MRADAVGDAVGLAVGHAHASVVEPQGLGANLRHHGLEALAERCAAGDELDHPRRVDLDPHTVGRTEPALLHEHGEAGTHRLAGGAAARERGVELVPFERGQELVQEPGIIAGIVLDFLAQRLQRPVIGHLLGGDRVAAPHLVGVRAEPDGDGIDQPLAHEGRLVTPGRAIGGRRCLVGQAEVADRAVSGHAVRSGEDSRCHMHDARGVGAHIGALVVKITVVDCEDAAFAVDRRANAMELLARVVGSDQVLAPVLDPLHRPVEPHGGDADQHILRI
jgi:hypothetical protein